MEQERYPAQTKAWTCPKCESTSFTEDTVTMTGKTWSRFMNITVPIMEQIIKGWLEQLLLAM